MDKNCVLLFTSIVILTKTLVISFDLPSFNLNNIHYPLSEVYKQINLFPQTALNVLEQANPLNYVENSDSSHPKQNGAIKPSNSYEHAANSSPLQNGGDQQSQFFTGQYSKNKTVTNKLPYGKTQGNLYEIATSKKNDYDYDRNNKTTTDMSAKRNMFTALNVDSSFNHFMQVLERLERKFYQISFYKLLTISPSERHENGISFAQSGLFLYIQLMALCMDSDAETAKQIKISLGLKTQCAEQVQLLKKIMTAMPKSHHFLKFHWSSRLVLAPHLYVSQNFFGKTASDLHIRIDKLNKMDEPSELAKRLNNMVEIDSGGAMRDTFEEDELSTGVCAAWLTTMYLRAGWRSAPTVLNGTRGFHDGAASPRTVRMIRINDVMRYAQLDEWDAEAIEIQYAHPHLTFLLLLPRERSLRNLAKWISTEDLQRVYEKMQAKRIAVILPIYTLRMTLLLPGKLETMGISRLVNAKADCGSLRLSHAVQRIMFWAEAGHNAFKDDGIEWDEPPEFERIADRPYIFFVRWRNLTLLNGNFVL